MFGVGTDLVTARDAPALGGIYKIAEIESGGQRRYAAKFSESKVTYPGRKQVFRFSGPDGVYKHDVLGLGSEDFSDAEVLLEPMLKEGKLTKSLPTLDQIRERAIASLARLPESCRRLETGEPYPVRKSKALEDLVESVRGRYAPLPAGAGGEQKAR
jgi:nicotinate phosphoribosyltransferase